MGEVFYTLVVLNIEPFTVTIAKAAYEARSGGRCLLQMRRRLVIVIRPS